MDGDGLGRARPSEEMGDARVSYWEECMYDWHGSPSGPPPRPPIEMVATKIFETEDAVLFNKPAYQFWVPKKAIIAIEWDKVLLCDWCRINKMKKRGLRNGTE